MYAFSFVNSLSTAFSFSNRYVPFLVNIRRAYSSVLVWPDARLGNIMSLVRWWNYRHSILRTSTLDEMDEICAGKQFRIRYLGCTRLDRNGECDFQRIAGEILNNFPNGISKKIATLELFVDSKFLLVRETQNRSLTLLEISISDVRDILYRKRDVNYGHICIFVARDTLSVCRSPEL